MWEECTLIFMIYYTKSSRKKEPTCKGHAYGHVHVMHVWACACHARLSQNKFGVNSVFFLKKCFLENFLPKNVPHVCAMHIWVKKSKAYTTYIELTSVTRVCWHVCATQICMAHAWAPFRVAHAWAPFCVACAWHNWPWQSFIFITHVIYYITFLEFHKRILIIYQYPK